jgi:hypothetical protein
VVAYHWETETITALELSTILYEQYNGNPTVSIPIPDGNRIFNFKRDLVPVTCNRCGHKFQIQPVLLLSMKDDRGYTCSQCGNLSDKDLQEKIRVERLKAGRRTLIDEGIDPDSEEEKSDEEIQEELDQDLATSMYDGDTDVFDYDAIAAVESARAANVASPPAPPPPPAAETVLEKPKEAEPPKSEPAKEKSAESSSMDEMITFSEDDYSSIEGWEDGEAEEEKPEEEPKKEEPQAEQVTANESETPDEEDETEETEDEAEEEVDEDEDEYIELNNKRWTAEELADRYSEISKILVRKIGYAPFGDITIEDGTIHTPCKVCDNVLETDDIEALLDQMITLDEAACKRFGIPYKGTIQLSACPHCRESIYKKGYNEYFRKKVEDIAAKRKIKIVNPESYYYASPLDEYVFEANGVQKKIGFVDLCNKYRDVDLSKHELFKPRGTATKSEATSVENAKNDIPKATFSIPEFDAKSQFHIGAAENAYEQYYERQQKQAKSQMVFHPSETIKNSRKDYAVLSPNENPFEHEKKLEAAFTKSIFFKFIEELSEECNVSFKYTINQRTFEIPVVDFHPYKQDAVGFRLVCADLHETSLANAPFSRIATSIPFSFKNNKDTYDYKYSILFDDSVIYREKATFEALVKYINPSVLSYGGKRIQLEGNMNIQYTDYSGYLSEFNEHYSPFPDGKPRNAELGIIASWIPEKEINSRDILQTLTSLENRDRKRHNLSSLESEQSSYLVCAIRYIERMNEDIGRIVYTITEYIEIGNSLLADGLYQCLKALIKEYCINHPNMKDRTPHIIIELDPNNYPSPSISHYIKKGSLIPIDSMYKSHIMTKKDKSKIFMANKIEQHLRYNYIRRKEYRERDADGMRKDMRKLNAPGLIRMMPEEIKAAGLQKGIFEEVQRNIFIMNMGFIKAAQLEIKEYFVHQEIVNRIMLDSNTIMLNKFIDPDLVFNQSGIVENSSNQINTANTPFFNPAFAQKMGRIEKGYVTPEARDFYASYMQQKQQQAMADMYYNAMRQQQSVNQNPWQQPISGVYNMPPRMPGM